MFLVLGLALAVIVQAVPAQAQTFTQVGSQTQVGAASTSFPACIHITNGLFLGASDKFMSGGNVMRLQNFLISNGYLSSGNATGFFGPLTFSAVAKFQRANGVSAIGLVGPQTRAKILAVSCGAPIPPVVNPGNPQFGVPTVTSVSPASGPIGTTVTVYGSGFGANTTVNFGGSFGPNVRVINSGTLTFTVPSQLLPACAYGNIVCLIGGSPVTQGSYQVSVKNSVGTSNSVAYWVTNGGGNPINPGTGAPVISGIDSPSSLSVGQSGTWTVRASDAFGGNGNLSYRVVWGDEHLYGQAASAAQMSTAFVQSATFTHAYPQAGTYTPRFYVRSSNGMTAEVSATVNVSGQTQVQAPRISYISPTSGGYNQQITIVGSGFDRYSNHINYAGVSRVAMNVPSVDGTTLSFTVPATPCAPDMICAQVVLNPGTYPISVTNSKGTSNSVSYTLNPNVQQPVNQTVSAAIGQTAYVGNGFQIRPLRIVEDSRCPSGVYCFQAGKVVVETQLQSLDMLQNSNISFGASDGMTTATIDGYTVRIVSVAPQARQGGVGSNEYWITYQVTR